MPSVQFAAAEEPEGTARVPAPGAEARRVLERARVVLLALAHADSTDDLSVLAPLAASVAADAAALVGDASPEGVLVGRLEPVLLTLAHLGPTDDPAATRMLRQQVDRHEFLLRLDLALVAAGPPIEDPE